MLDQIGRRQTAHTLWDNSFDVVAMIVDVDHEPVVLIGQQGFQDALFRDKRLDRNLCQFRRFFRTSLISLMSVESFMCVMISG